VSNKVPLLPITFSWKPRFNTYTSHYFTTSSSYGQDSPSCYSWHIIPAILCFPFCSSHFSKSSLVGKVIRKLTAVILRLFDWELYIYLLFRSWRVFLAALVLVGGHPNTTCIICSPILNMMMTFNILTKSIFIHFCTSNGASTVSNKP
jgi:hypothetical protein